MSRRKKRKTQEEKDRSTQFSIPKVFSTAQTPTEIHIIGLGREGAEFSLIEFTLIKFIYSLNFSRASFFYSLSNFSAHCVLSAMFSFISTSFPYSYSDSYSFPFRA